MSLTQPSLPRLEAERLQTLRAYRILDTPPEAAFDRLTALAARLFDVPIALVSLVDQERQWFKSSFGLEIRQTERSLSFCSHTICSDDVLVVPDATLDPRFAQNTLVTGEPHIRFYAGVPLKAPNGHNIGSLCIIDTVPRHVSAESLDGLSSLAAIAVDELEFRRMAGGYRNSTTALRQSARENSQLEAAVSSLTSGVVITDPNEPDNPLTFVNAGFTATTGYSSEEAVGRNCRFLQGPDTDPFVLAELRQALTQKRPFKGILLNYRKDGTPFLNQITITPVFDAAGHLMSFVGLQEDVTERERAKQMLEYRVRQRTEELALSQVEILTRLAKAAEFRDDDTGQHTQRVAYTCSLLAQALGLPSEQVTQIGQAAPLHDVGKIAISDLILLKPGKLTEEEFVAMRNHAVIGAMLLSGGHSEVVQMAERIAESHHERWDGTGYPRGLAGEAIPLEGRILAVADVFDALTHERPYKKAWPVEDAVAEIVRQRGQQFDPQVVDAFLTLPHQNLI